MFRSIQKPRPLVLCILDGWGMAEDSPANAISRADPINFKGLLYSYPYTLLQTTGTSVGLPEAQVGNSEVGHMNLGAGRIVYQDSLRILSAISDGSFFQNEAFKEAINYTKTKNSKLHIMGLVSTGIVHSYLDHLFALISLTQSNGLTKSQVKLHLFTDGRDSSPTSGVEVIKKITERIQTPNYAEIASISGRYYAMDRDNRWDRIEKAYSAIKGTSLSRKMDPLLVMEENYRAGRTDEFVEPTTITSSQGLPKGAVQDNDSVIFFNFRADRARQLTKAFVQESLGVAKTPAGEKIETFQRGEKPQNLCFVTMTQYEKDLPVTAVAFEPQEVLMPISRVFAERSAKQFHIAETEKYAHVTYFFNGRREAPFSGEDRLLVPSPKTDSYDKTPQMSSQELTRSVLQRINSEVYDFIVINFAGADMVAHTGNFEATQKAVKTIDFYLGVIAKTTLAAGGGLIVTADHGNAERLMDEAGNVDTEHNASPAPCIFALKELQGKSQQLHKGILADVAPTILNILRIPPPSVMTGRNLLE